MSNKNYHLVTRKGPKPGQVYPLVAPTITIGRDPMSDIVLNDPEVSRYHAQLVQVEDGYQIQDMGSTNGTFVAGQRLERDPVLLMLGQDVAFGSGIQLTYEITGGGDEFDQATSVESARKPDTAVPESSAPPLPHYAPQAGQPLVPTADDAERKKRRNMIIIAVILILLFCCCGFILFMWFIGGDWLLEQAGIQLSLPLFYTLF